VPDSLYWCVELFTLAAILKITVPQLWRQKGDRQYLCGDCRFNRADDCQKKERPFALDCTSYRPEQLKADSV
jgi:hypothetical protein